MASGSAPVKDKFDNIFKVVRSIFPFQLNAVTDSADDKAVAIMINDQTICRQSLLLQCAVTYASVGHTVCFVAPKPLASLPPTVHGMTTPAPSNMRLIKFVYYPNYLDTVKMMSAMHMTAPLPSLIIVDELNYYISQMMEDDEWEQTISKFLGLLLDTANFISNKREQVCPLLVSCHNCAEFLKHPSIVKLFFNELWQIQALDDITEGKDFYNLVAKNLRDINIADMHVNFRWTSSQLMLDKVLMLFKR